MTHPKPESHRRLERGKPLRQTTSKTLGPLGMAKPAEALGEIPGVDRNGTCRGAQAVHRARIERHIGECGFQRPGQLGIATLLLQPHHLSPHHDALARRESQVLARALRLAVTALDALVHLILDPRYRLEVGEVRSWIGVEDHAGIEQPVGVHQLLETLHDGVALGAPLGLDEGRDVAPGPMLALERPVILPHHQADHVVHEPRVPVHLGLCVVRLRDREVQVPVFGMAKDDRFLVAVPSGDADQLHGGVRQAIDREDHVLDNHRGAPLPRGSHGRVQPLADLPEECLFRRVVGEAPRLE